MAIVAPKERKPLSAAALLRLVRSGFDTVPDPRSLDAEISFTDALMSAFAMFALQSPSLLAFDPQRAEGKVKTIYGMACVPCDTRMRERLDPMSPEALRLLCKSVCRQIQRGKALEPMACLEDDYCVALDGTGSCSSKPIHCASCLHKVHRNGSSPSSHQMLGAAIIHPEGRAVMPLMPEPLVKQDGTVKNDGERHAAKRFLGKLRQDHPHLTGMVTADSLRANAPHIETLPAHGLHAILGVKEGDHASLCQQGQAAAQRGGVTFYARHDRDAGLVPRFRFVNDVSLKESNAEVRVNVIEDWARRTDAGQHWSWVTDLRVSQRNVYHLMRGGRARWKMANATLNTLKNQGSHFEHNYGHGTQHLSVGFAMVMLLALVVDQPQQLCCALCQAVWAKLGSKRLLWERMRALCDDDALESMRQLLETLLYGLKKLHPLLAVDAS